MVISTAGVPGNRLVDGRHHMLRHQLHRPSGELLVHPVVTCVEEGAEVADLVAKRQDRFGDLVWRAIDHQLLDDGRDVQFLVRLIPIGLKQVGAAASLQPGGQAPPHGILSIDASLRQLPIGLKGWRAHVDPEEFAVVMHGP